MKPQWLHALIATAVLVLTAAADASAQSDRFVGVRKDASDEVILFSIDVAGGAERKIATLQKAETSVQLLGITAVNSRRGTFSYAYTDRAAGKDYLHTVSLLNGQTVSRFALPADIGGLEALVEGARPQEAQLERGAIARKLEALEQEVRRLQSQLNQVRSR
jgi:hypothetical protein